MPGRVIGDAVGWIRDHQAGDDPVEEGSDGPGIGAVAAGKAMPAEEPDVAWLADRLLADLRHLVLVGETFSAVRGKSAGELVLIEVPTSPVRASTAAMCQYATSALKTGPAATVELRGKPR